MALNFPNSPTDGQIYTDTPSGNRWVWDSANTVWKATSTFTQTITVSSTAPASPATGQLWWNQDFGRLLVYYNDGNSSQWVDASPSDYTSALAYAQANAAYNTANSFGGVYGVANAAFSKANTALQNTNVTLAGDLTISGNVTHLSTTGLKIPVGTTSQRSANTTGMIRYNTDLGYPEYYSPLGSLWLPFFTAPTYTIDIMLVGGGGSGGTGAQNYGGGGGAGGLIFLTGQTMQPGNSYSIIIGSGGAQSSGGTIGNNGANTTGFGLIALGGGGGGTQGVAGGNKGGSGGGGGFALAGGAGIQPVQSGNSGTYGYGNDGGTGNQSPNGGGGGGGAGAVGYTATPCNGGAGKDMSSYFGTTYGASGWFAGGGGGSNQSGYPTPQGGQGGGGTGTVYNSNTQTPGTGNTGGGGGAGGSSSPVGMAGGSGIALIRYLGAQRASGGTVYSYGGCTIHAFTANGTFTT